jgi:hypothetical protein
VKLACKQGGAIFFAFGGNNDHKRNPVDTIEKSEGWGVGGTDHNFNLLLLLLLFNCNWVDARRQ